MSARRHLVTGGSGFIGSLVARKLRARGDFVRVLDTWDDPARPHDIEFVKGSILDQALVARAVQGIDVVHHGAALVAQTDAGSRFAEVNATGAKAVADAAVRAGVGAIVHISTTAVFGLPPHGAIDEHTPLRPIEAYGRSKLAGERVMASTCERGGVTLVTIRPRATLGAGRLGIFGILFDWIRDGRSIPVIGSGHNAMQFVHADDLIDFYMLALDAGKPGAYNVGTDRFGTLRGDLEALIADIGSASRVRSLPVAPAIAGLSILHSLGASPLVPWHYRTYHRDCHFDVAPLLELGWRPRYSNAAMLRESYDWFCAQSAPLAASPHRAPLRQGLLRWVKAMA